MGHAIGHGDDPIIYIAVQAVSDDRDTRTWGVRASEQKNCGEAPNRELQRERFDDLRDAFDCSSLDSLHDKVEVRDRR
jgi:hypothetical protein